MSKTQTIAKFAALAAGFGLVASAVAPSFAAAQTTTTTSTSTTADQIAALQAQIAALQAQLSGTSTATASVTFTRDLTIGSTGSDVTALQTWLIAKGYSVPAGATGYFGTQTKAALAAYQAANAISPAAGYFGPITRAKVNASATTTTTTTTTTTGGTTTTTTGTLSGGEGSLDNFKTVGASNTSLNAADMDTVYGFEFKAGGSDLMINRVDFDLVRSTAGTGSASTRPWNVFQTATLMKGNTTIATLDASNQNNYSEDGTVNGIQQYRLRFDGLKDVVKMDATADYYLQLTTQNVISSSNNNNVYSVTLASQGVRAVDAMGIQQYSPSSTGGNYNSVSVSTNTSGSLTLSTGSDNPQVGTTVQANSNSQTSNVVLTTFTLQAKDADVMVYSIPATIATTTGANAANLVRNLRLYQGSTVLDTESISSSQTSGANATSTLNFDDLNIRIPAGTTQTFSIQADINSVGGTSNVAEGSGLSVSIPNFGFDAANTTGGNNVNVTGSVTGNIIVFRSIGLSFDTTPTTSATAQSLGTSGTQQGNFTFTFNVTAFGQDIFFSKNANVTTSGTLYSNGTATSTVASSTALTSTADVTGSNNYVIHSGQTKSVTVTVTVPQGTNAPINAVLNTFRYGTAETNVSASSTQLNNNYQTAPVYLHS